MQLPRLAILLTIYATTATALWCPYQVPDGTADGYCVRACREGSSTLNCSGSRVSFCYIFRVICHLAPPSLVTLLYHSLYHTNG
ncbi:hypothetical protein V8F20_009011 [Naviculisporaceae sp. PSN 640]